MDLAFSAEDQAFQAHVRDTLAGAIPPDIEQKVRRNAVLERDDYIRWQDVLARHVGSQFVGDGREIVCTAQAALDLEVDFDEVREVGELIPRLQCLWRVGRQRHAISFGQPQQRGRLDSSLEMDVQLRLGHLLDESV